jgi:hypothetical protein
VKIITVPKTLLVTAAAAISAWTRCVPAAWVITIAVAASAAWAYARSYAWTAKQFAAAWAWLEASLAGRDLTIPGWSEHWLWGGQPRWKPAAPPEDEDPDPAAPDTTGEGTGNIIAITARTGHPGEDRQSADEAVA